MLRKLAPLFLGTTSVLSATRGLPEFENGFLNVFKNFGGDAEIFQDFPWPVMRVHRRTWMAMDASWMRLDAQGSLLGAPWGRSWATRGRFWAFEGLPWLLKERSWPPPERLKSLSTQNKMHWNRLCTVKRFTEVPRRNKTASFRSLKFQRTRSQISRSRRKNFETRPDFFWKFYERGVGILGASVDVKDAAADCQDASEFSFFRPKKDGNFLKVFGNFWKNVDFFFFFETNFRTRENWRESIFE